MTLPRPRPAPLLPTLVLALAFASAAGAQQTSPLPDSVLYGDIEAAGRLDGHRVADGPSVLGYAAAGFVGGVPVGIFGLFAIGTGDGQFVLPAGGGLALAVASGVHGSRPVDLPARLAARLEGRSPEYRRAFRESYAERLRGRRRSAAVMGGIAGAAAGFAFLLSIAARGYD